MKRIVFGAKLAANCLNVLSDSNVKPDYYFGKSKDSDAATQRVVDFWMNRWLTSRINHLPALKSVQAFDTAVWLQDSFRSIGLEIDLTTNVLQEA
jgi:hypothetical protein